MASIATTTAVPTTAPKDTDTTNSRTVALSPFQGGPANVSVPIEQLETASSTLKASAEEYRGTEPKTNPEELEELKKAFLLNEEAVEALVSELARKRTELKALEKLTRQGEEYSRVPKSLLTVSEKGLRIVSNTELCVVDGKTAYVVGSTPARKKFLLNSTCKVYHDNGELVRATTGVEEWKTKYEGLKGMEEKIAVVVDAFHKKESLEEDVIGSALLEQLKKHVKEQRKKKKSPTECFGGATDSDAYGIVLRVTLRSGESFLVCLKEQLGTLEMNEYLFLHRQQSLKTVEVLCGECYVEPYFRKKTVGKKRDRVAKPLPLKKTHMIKGEVQCSCCKLTTFWPNVSDRLCTYMSKNGPWLLKKIGIPEDIRPQYKVTDKLLETSKLKEDETCVNCLVKAICTDLNIDYVKHPEHRQASVLYVLEKLLGLKQSVWTLNKGKLPSKCQPLLPELGKRLASLSTDKQKDLYSLTVVYYISRNKCFTKMNEATLEDWQLDIKNKMRCLVAGHRKPEPIVPKKKKKPDVESDVESEQGPNSTEYDFDALMDDDEHAKEDDPKEDDKDRKMTVEEARQDEQTDKQLEDELLGQDILTDNEEETEQPTVVVTAMVEEATVPETDMEVAEQTDEPAAEANDEDEATAMEVVEAAAVPETDMVAEQTGEPAAEANDEDEPTAMEIEPSEAPVPTLLELMKNNKPALQQMCRDRKIDHKGLNKKPMAVLIIEAMTKTTTLATI